MTALVKRSQQGAVVRISTLAKGAELRAAILMDAAELLRGLSTLRRQHREMSRSIANATPQRDRLRESIARLRAMRRDLKRKTK